MPEERARFLPSEHQAARDQVKKEVEEASAEAKRKADRLKRAVDKTLESEDGRLVWAWLFNRCLYNKAILLRVGGGDVAPISTECAAAQREVYRELRGLASPRLLVRAEFEAEFGEVLKQEEKGA